MASGNGRYGGGTAGSETRYCREAVDVDRFDEAHEGASSASPLHSNAPNREEAAMVNTMSGGRGKCMGATYPDDKWRSGF